MVNNIDNYSGKAMGKPMNKPEKKRSENEIKDIENVKTVVKYSCSSSASYVVDIFLFTIFNIWLSKYMGPVSIIFATIMARVASSLFNYFLNSRIVFSDYNKDTIVKYYIMVIVQMFNSAIMVYMLSFVFTASSATMIKMCVDFFIFFENYMVQKKYIFK